MLTYIVYFFVLVALSKAIPIETPKSTEEALEFRLKETTIPSHYDITIQPYLLATNPPGKTQFTFDGKSTVTVFAKAGGKKTIQMNTKNLMIDKTKTKIVQSGQNTATDINILSQEETTETEILTLTLETELLINETYIISFEYVGQMDEDMQGFYRSSYIEEDKTIWIGATQFEQTHARRVFPGFDEPSYKATISLTLIIPESYNALANTHEMPSSVPPTDGWKTISFKKSPKMSTYLLAFVVSNFKQRKNDVDDRFSVWARPEQYDQTLYATNVGLKLLNHLTEFTGVQYYTNDIEKVDNVALPDFNAGAMENWGLITYRETALLFDTTIAAASAKQRVASVVAHELAHQWFGNLVTCEWWGNTWLNEGFATYFEFFSLTLEEPGWELEKQFIYDAVQRSLVYDSQDTTHALSHTVNSPTEASAAFSLVSYQKGGSIIRMIEHYIGTAKFKQALTNYLNQNAYGVGTPDELLAQFQNAVGEETQIVDILKPWITQPGYPVVNVKVSDDRKSAELTQKRFTLKAAETTEKWSIPLTFTQSSFDSLTPTHVFPSGSDSFKIENMSPDKWVIFNIQESGFYRVNYDKATWSLISTAIKKSDHDGIHELNRAQIVDDLLNLARAGELGYDTVFPILEYLMNEKKFVPWFSAFTNFLFLASKMNDSALKIFKSHIIELVENIYKDLGFTQSENDTLLTIYHRENVIKWACKAGQPACIKNAKDSFKSFRTEGKSVHPNIRAHVYCSAIREGNEEDFKFLWDKYIAEPVATEQVLILTSLGCVRDTALLKEYLTKILSPSVRLQDKRSALTGTYSQTEENLQHVLDYVIANHAEVVTATGKASEMVTTLTNLAARFTSQSQIDQLQKFISDNSGTYSDTHVTTLKKAVADATDNLAWINKNVPKITEYIINHQKSFASKTSISFTLMGIMLVVQYLAL